MPDFMRTTNLRIEHNRTTGEWQIKSQVGERWFIMGPSFWSRGAALRVADGYADTLRQEGSSVTVQDECYV